MIAVISPAETCRRNLEDVAMTVRELMHISGSRAYAYARGVALPVSIG